jgi:hypothetical protein
MAEEERLRAEAERCLRLSQLITTPDVSAALAKRASDYLERADALGSRAGQRQQSGDQPPAPLPAQDQQPAQQQQQTQPKDGED